MPEPSHQFTLGMDWGCDSVKNAYEASMFQNLQKNLEICQSCPKLCHHACPVLEATGDTALSPWGLINTMGDVAQGKLGWTLEAAESMYACTGCGACQEVCGFKQDVPSLIHEGRKQAIESGWAPKSVQGFLEKFGRYNNPFAKDLLAMLHDSFDEDDFADSAHVFFPGCGSIALTPEVVSDTISLWRKLKIDFVRFYPEPFQCCGYPLLSGGLEDEFIDLAEIQFHALKKYKTVIVGSPACAHTLRHTYAKYDFNLKNRVLSMVEFLEPFLNSVNFQLKKDVPQEVLLHEPCHLARHLDQSELPRDIVAQVAGSEAKLFRRNGRQTQCSGQGGLFSITHPEEAASIAQGRLDEAHNTRPDVMITHCASCLHKFRKAAGKLKVQDLVSYVNSAIESSE